MNNQLPKRRNDSFLVPDPAPRVIQGELVNESEYDARQRLEALAWLLDNSIYLPGLNVRIGLDALIGLVPVVGDLVSAALSTYLMAEASRMGVSRAVLARMAGNVLIDTVLGAVPFVGDLFDMGWKANSKNVRLLVNHLERPQEVTRNSWLIVLGFAIALLGILGGLGYLLMLVFTTLWNTLT